METNGNDTRFTTPTDRSVQIEREFDAPPEAVFDAFLDPTLVEQWWGPERYSIKVDRMDTTPGGEWRVVHSDTEGNEYTFFGEFRQIDRPYLISRTFEYDGAPGHVSVETARFEPTEDGAHTRVIARDEFDTKEERDAFMGDPEEGMKQGATESFERLAELLENGNRERQQQTEGTHQAQQYDNIETHKKS